MNLLKKILTSFSIILITSNSLADVSEIPILKGQPAPITGYLFTHDKTVEIYRTYLERDAFKADKTSLQKSLDLEKNNVDILQKDNSILYDSLQKSKSSTDLQKILWFAAGVITAGLAVDGASKLLH